MNRTKNFQASFLSGLMLSGAIALGMVRAVDGQDIAHLPVIQPGGMPGTPVMTGVEKLTNGFRVSWYGPSGYYQLFRKLGLNDPAWAAVGGLTQTNQADITTISSNAFFRVLGPAPHYAGIDVCAECHAETHETVAMTPHIGAFTNALFVSLGGQTNASCLPCHTVGAGLPSGFVNNLQTPHLAGVQCENCHGPAGNHAANPDDPLVRPRIELASTVCGGCHNSRFAPANLAVYHPPYFEDWNKSAHRAVRQELKQDFLSASGPTVFVPSCGRCHSGAVRESLLEDEPLPDGHEAGAIGIACATCHEPHEPVVHTNVLAGVVRNVLNGVTVTNNQLGAVYTNLLRNPLSSIRDYFLSTSDDFSGKYDPDVNVCGQCHNHRGAVWQTSSRPPHQSPQYNFLLGTVGELSTGVAPNQPATHALLEKQCVRCHMQTNNVPTLTSPASAGHQFVVASFDTCRECHSLPEQLVQFTTASVSNRIQQVKGLLDQWATTKAPAALRNKYGALAWEYTLPGQLSSGASGPTAAEQTQISTNIQKARFDLYLVLHDGSFGVHNGPYSIMLLNTAQSWVQAELNK